MKLALLFAFTSSASSFTFQSKHRLYLPHAFSTKPHRCWTAPPSVITASAATFPADEKEATTTWERNQKDVLSGVVVALASIPSSIAFAQIAGVSPLIGIWSSVLLGLVSSTIGGIQPIIAGAAGVVVVPLAPLIATHGVTFMGPAVLLAAVIEGLFSVFKLGRYVDVVDDNVMKGFLNGLGCLLIKSQIGVFAGLTGAALYAAAGIASITAAVTKTLPRISSAVPSSLVGIVVATAVSVAMKLPVVTLSDVAGAGTFAGGLSVIPSFVGLRGLLGAVPWSLQTLTIIAPAAISVALISILESLLAGKVVTECESLDYCDASTVDENKKAMANDRLLAGLSLGNAISALFGGFGGSGLIPQTLLNLQSGGTTKLSAVSYALAMAVMVVAAAPLIGAIPLAALAGVMLTVAFSTVQLEWTLEVARSALGKKKNQDGITRFVALAATSFMCYFVDMAAGIGLGVVITKALGLLKRNESGL